MPPSALPSDDPAHAWWWSAIGSSEAVQLLAIMAALAIGIAFLAWRAWAVAHAQANEAPSASVKHRLADDAGTATIEFTLVFPVLLVMILALIQTTFMFTGNLFVHYAAFAAARKAIVEVPRNLATQGEGTNVVAAELSQKLENIRGAAAFALAPVAGPGTDTSALGGVDRPLGSVVDALYQAEGLDAPRWAEQLIDRRMQYALEHTAVELGRLRGPNEPLDQPRRRIVSPVPEGNPYRYGPRDPITVTVRHRLHLSIPFIGSLFRDGIHTVDERDAPYREITGDFMLTNEGISQQLPPESNVPRG